MSLIQEALRRQQGGSGKEPDKGSGEGESGGEELSSAGTSKVQHSLKLKTSKSPEGPGAASPSLVPQDAPAEPETGESAAPETMGKTPPPLPAEEPAAPAPSQASRSRTWPIMVGVLACGVLVIGGGVWLAVHVVQNLLVSKEPAGAKPAAAPAKVAPKVPATKPPDKAPAPTVAAKKPVEKLPEETVPVPAPTTVSNKPPLKKAVLWPILTVRGLLSTGPKGGAIINSEIVAIDQEIEGVKVVAIGKDTVTLKFQGETRVLRVGDITN